MMLSLQFNTKRLEIPFAEDSSNDIITVPPNCEIIRQIITNSNEPSVVLKAELENGLYVGNTISDPKFTYIRVININDNPRKLNLKSLTILPLSNFDILNATKSTKSNNRTEQVLNDLKNSYPEHIESNFREVLEKYTDIFKIQSDKASINNFYEQSLNLKDNECT